ncbi:hypothetical protein LCGC14_2827090 [marine sediment metagenome]|uniref:Uncharacterized protein n=1 Tax=marine sediment metagenome TaxID=412755 RepID=A0A0F8YF61_9ZZZZ
MLYLEDFKNLAKGGQPVTLEFTNFQDTIGLTIHSLGRHLEKGIVATFDEFTTLIAKALKKLADEEKTDQG